MQETEVTGCSNCPMAELLNRENNSYCQHPNTKDQVIRFRVLKVEGKPEWCPLKKESLLIKLV